MPGESVNPVFSGNDSANPPTDLDNPANLDFAEPELEEGQANQDAEQEGTVDDSETDATDDGQESGEPETADESAADAEGEADKAAAEVKDDVVVTLQSGDKVALSELKSGYMRDRDYRHKTTELSNKRRDLEALSTRVTQSVNAVAELLVKQIPPEPDLSLSVSDPGRYVQEKALHDAMMAQVNAVIEQASAPKDAVNKLTQEQRAEVLRSENAKLAEAFPQTSTEAGRKTFFESAAGAAKDLGYSDDEIRSVTDHRLFGLAYYARIGLQAEQAKAKAKAKVANVPPVTPAKRPQGSASKVRANQDAMKRLNKTGSIHDAMAIDFD